MTTTTTVTPTTTSLATSETVRWLRPYVAVVVVGLTLVAAVTPFGEDMPAFHRLAAPIAAAVMLAAWAIELAGLGWPRLVLILGVVLPNVWLTLIGHVSANILFLILLLAWVGAAGTRAESVLAFALAFATVALGIGLDALDGQVAWAGWTSWLVGLVLTWLMALVLGREERLVTELQRLRSDAEERSRELETLLGVSHSVASTLEMRPLMDAILDALGTLVDYRGTAIFTLDEAQQALVFAHMRGPTSFTWEQARQMRYAVDDLPPLWERLCRDEAIVLGDVRGDSADAHTFRRLVGHDRPADGGEDPYAFIRSLMWVPLVSRGRLIGMLSIANPEPNAYGPRQATLALAIGRQAAVALDNAQLHERARQAAVLEERARLARELHDSVTQSLYGVSLYAEAASRSLDDSDLEPAAANLHEIRQTVQEALGEMRLLLFELRPPLVDELGLAGAIQSRLQAVEARAGLATDLQDASGGERLPPTVEQELFRIVQEALNNVLKHAHATRVRVRLEVTSACAVLEVADNGVGFEPALGGVSAGGFGLPGIRERAQRLGGAAHITSAPGDGTCVRVEVPRR